jgi:hypothetical protein
MLLKVLLIREFTIYTKVITFPNEESSLTN